MIQSHQSWESKVFPLWVWVYTDRWKSSLLWQQLLAHDEMNCASPFSAADWKHERRERCVICICTQKIKKSRSLESLKYHCRAANVKSMAAKLLSELTVTQAEGEAPQAGKGKQPLMWDLSLWKQPITCWSSLTLWGLHERRDEHQDLNTCHLENYAHAQCLDHKTDHWPKWKHSKIRT